MSEAEEFTEEEEDSEFSRISQLDDELAFKLESAFESPTPKILLHNISKITAEYDAVDLAYAVTRLPPQERVIVYENLPDTESKVIFIVNTGTTTRTAIFRRISDQDIKKLIEEMPLDEAVWILEDMSDRRLRRVLELIEPKKRSRIIDLQKHDRNSAGRLMTNEFFQFHMNTKISEVALQIRDNPGIALTKYIFVIGDQGELIGVVPSRALIINPDYLPLRQVMRPVLYAVTADESREEVVDIVERYKIEALPVVDDEKRLVGVITYEDVVEAMEDIADTTIASIGGTAEEIGEGEPIIRRFFYRAPWLIVTLFAGLTNTAVLAHFYHHAWFAIVPLFIPLVTGLSGNVGIQCSTILVRWMSSGELSFLERRTVVFNELAIGLLIGTVFGLLCGFTVWMVQTSGIHHFQGNIDAIVLMVTCGIFGSCFTSTILGTFSPFFFARFGIDPAVASGPIVTAFNDVMATFMFIVIAQIVSSLVT